MIRNLGKNPNYFDYYGDPKRYFSLGFILFSNTLS